MDAVGFGRRYRDWLERQDQWVTRHKRATWQREQAERLLGRHRRLFSERAFIVINGRYWLGGRLSQERRSVDALDVYEQVLVQWAERYGPDHRRTRAAKLAVAITLAELGRNQEASCRP